MFGAEQPDLCTVPVVADQHNALSMGLQPCPKNLAQRPNSSTTDQGTYAIAQSKWLGIHAPARMCDVIVLLEVTLSQWMALTFLSYLLETELLDWAELPGLSCQAWIAQCGLSGSDPSAPIPVLSIIDPD